MLQFFAFQQFDWTIARKFFQSYVSASLVSAFVHAFFSLIPTIQESFGPFFLIETLLVFAVMLLGTSWMVRYHRSLQIWPISIPCKIICTNPYFKVNFKRKSFKVHIYMCVCVTEVYQGKTFIQTLFNFKNLLLVKI